ncbi:MAG: terpene cyclase/mutase family protein [Rubripirellula sp.]|nr:terpene cyclase/mutase family protein [Rubripirellula sp.]
MLNQSFISLATTVVLGIPLAANLCFADEPTGPVRAAISKAIPLLQAGAQGSAEQRKCFTCHSQAVPVLALAKARGKGFAIDEPIFDQQMQHTFAHLKRGQKEYAAGRGQGGGVMTAGYALWTLDAGQQEASEVTAAVAHFLLNHQQASNRWRQASKRPPTSGSDFTTTYVALRGLLAFGTEQQQPEIAKRMRRASEWILKQAPVETEDRVFRLLTMRLIQADQASVQNAISALTDSQRDDGGWGQLENAPSDAYATATAMFALQYAGKLTWEDASIQKGIKYLLRHQLDDGSWHVVTRAEPIQTYFETGFPHGNDQFISIAASGWATASLSLSLPSQ